LVRLVGKESDTVVTFTVPFTAKDRTDAGMNHRAFAHVTDGNGSGSTTYYGWMQPTENTTTVTVYWDAAGSAWNTDNTETRSVVGQFTYVAD